jgi:hypothetical protein
MLRRALLLGLLVSSPAVARRPDGGVSMRGLLQNKNLLEQVQRSAPGDSTVAIVLLAKLMRDEAWLSLLESGKPATLLLPHFNAQDAAFFEGARRAAAATDLRGFYGPGELPVPTGASVAAEDRVGAVRILYLDGALPWANAAVSGTSAPPAPPAPARPWSTFLAENLAHVRGEAARRVVMDPAKKPYLGQLVHVFGQLKLDPAAIQHDAPSKKEVRACESAFLEAVAKDLGAGTFTVVRRERAHGFRELFQQFPRYDAQVIGWRVNGARYVYLRYRLSSATHLPPLDTEYFVMDGGHAYFEYQCQLPQRSLFNVVVHGEA